MASVHRLHACCRDQKERSDICVCMLSADCAHGLYCIHPSIHPSSCCACVVVITRVSQVSANGALQRDDDREGSKARWQHLRARLSYLPDNRDALLPQR